MATLVQLRQALVEQSGHTGLVVSAPDANYTDKVGLITNATYYLNAGMRWLNRRWASKGTFRKVTTTIAEGEYLLDVSNIIDVRRIDVIGASDEARSQLRYLTFQEIRDYYQQPYADIEEGKPLCWSNNVQAVADAPGTDNIILLPPADGTYTVDIFTDLKTADLSADADTNWWTVYNPELVVRAARIQLEMDGHRNVSGYKAFQEQVEEEVFRLAAEANFAYIAGYTPGNFVPNG
jgi:hypothetical protein